MANFGVDMIGCDSQCSEHRIEMRFKDLPALTT